jgi:putative LPXTG-motif protein cell wall anchor domain protein
MVTGWKMINDKWYYFYEKTEGNMPKGAMAQNTVINGYRVDSNGAWIK